MMAFASRYKQQKSKTMKGRMRRQEKKQVTKTNPEFNFSALESFTSIKKKKKFTLRSDFIKKTLKYFIQWKIKCHFVIKASTILLSFPDLQNIPNSEFKDSLGNQNHKCQGSS